MRARLAKSVRVRGEENVVGQVRAYKSQFADLSSELYLTLDWRRSLRLTGPSAGETVCWSCPSTWKRMTTVLVGADGRVSK